MVREDYKVSQYGRKQLRQLMKQQRMNCVFNKLYTPFLFITVKIPVQSYSRTNHGTINIHTKIQRRGREKKKEQGNHIYIYIYEMNNEDQEMRRCIPSKVPKKAIIPGSNFFLQCIRLV